MRRAGAMAVAILMLAAGCREHKATAAPTEKSAKGAVIATTHMAPATAMAGTTFEDTLHHFATVYPAMWTMRQDATNALTACCDGVNAFLMRIISVI